MLYTPTTPLRTMLILTLVSLAMAGCGQDQTTQPVAPPTVIASDPLDDALKSLTDSPPTDAGDRIDRLTEALGLDDDQALALQDAYDLLRAGLDELREQHVSGELSLEEARVEAHALRELFEAELQVILTAEQWDRLQEMRLAGRDHRRHHFRHRALVARWVFMLTEIGAGEEQIEDVLVALHEKFEGLKALRREWREENLTCEEVRTAATRLRAAFDEALQSILTPEQYAALLDLRPDCGGPRGHGPK